MTLESENALPVITSRQNSAVRSLREAGAGRVPGAVFIEGARLVAEAVRCGLRIEAAAYCKGADRREDMSVLIDALRPCAERFVCLREDVFRFVSQTETPQGILARATRPANRAFDITPFPTLTAVAHRLQNPGNLGTVVRAAEAAGCGALFTTPDTADPVGPKALRASMGSAFRMPMETGVPLGRLTDTLRAHGLQIACATVRGDRSYTDVDWTQPFALVVCREAGESDARAESSADVRVCIPMRPPVESLNVGTAAAVILFEAARQRAWVSDGATPRFSPPGP